ncbi:MAG TPA: phytanoyl-CoA dioxygenase family protein [Armatimonadaceae bacterium]|nr:phytanoyl-CoA dioxygenase family protein [Armatimonadaceae bacterium]
MTGIGLDEEERAAGRMGEAKRAEALRALAEDGFVVLRGVIDVAHIDLLKERMLADLGRILARADAPFNFNTGNVQQAPPPFHPYLFRDVLFNEMVIGVTRAALGPGVKNGFYSGNTALPGGERQPVHPDVGQLWPDLAHATPPFGLVVNVPVVDMGPENGATELWPGTHRDTTYSIHDGAPRIPEEKLAPWRARRPPVQPTAARGDVLIRDTRLWHAGMPNHTEEPRPMIAMIHWASWWSEADAIDLPEEARDFFTHPALRTVARWHPSVDHLRHGQAYDLRRQTFPAATTRGE